MFHVDDDSDFDDVLLENSPASSDISAKLENAHESLLKNEIKSISSIPSKESNIFKEHTVQQNTVSQTEFLKLWEEQNENHSHNKLNITSPNNTALITRHVRKTVRQRKFPGPAGLLPERHGNTSLVATQEFLDDLNSENDDSCSFREKEVLSQSSGRIFDSGVWSSLMEDLGATGRKLISLMNLASLRLRHIRGYKVPFLAVVVNHIDCTLPDPTVIVKDPTDEMHGMLHREVWDKFNAEIIPGSVLVLKNVGVISAGTTSRRHVLNITANNLTAIYSSHQDEDVQVRKISELPTGDISIMLAEWDKVMSSPATPETISRNKSLPLNKSISGLINNVDNSFITPQKSLSSPLLKTSTNQRHLFNNSSTPINHHHQSSSSSSFANQPFKKRKNMPDNEIKSKQETKKQSVLKPLKNNTFNIDTAETSLVDSLLDGVDTDSLFEEF